MLDGFDRLAEALRHGIFTISIEYVVEVGLQGRSQGAIVSGPQPLHSCLVRFLSHPQDVIAFLKIEGKAHNIPALLQGGQVFGPCWVFEDIYFRDILTEEPQAEGNTPRHLKTPAESCRSVLAIIIVEAEILIDRGQQNASHQQRLQNEGLGRDAQAAQVIGAV